MADAVDPPKAQKSHKKADRSQVTYLQSLADLCPLGCVLIPRTLGDIGGREGIVYLLERALEV
jgi:hypothetical protein